MNADCLFGRFTLLVLLLGPPGYLRAQHIDDFNPKFAQVGENVDLSGSGFNTDPSQIVIQFNGAVATDFYVVSSSLIHVTVPPNASSGFITVQNASGSQVYSPQRFSLIGPGLYISDFSPTAGGPHSQVRINGAHFESAGVTAVKFNGLAAASFEANYDSFLLAEAPDGVTSGPITVSGPSGSFTSAQIFYASPAISTFSPASAKVGASVRITGLNLTNATAVQFNGVPAQSFTVDSNTQITAVVPANATDGKLTVITPGGPVESSTVFKILPSLNDFSPKAGDVGTSVTLYGAGFSAGTPVVRFNGTQAAPPTGITSSQLTAVVPAGATTGPISVTTANGSDTNANIFYLPLAVSSISPNAGLPGRWVTVAGRNFNGVTNVTFNGQSAQFYLTNTTTLGAKVPAGVTTGPIGVSTPAYSASGSQLFYGPPAITGFTPTHGLPGTNIVISGTNFLVVNAVRFNGSTADFTVADNGQIRATVPSSAVSGPLSVESPSGTNVSAISFTVDHPSNLTVWGTADPTPVTVGTDLTYTISIINNGPFGAPNLRLTNTVDPSVIVKSATVNTGTLATNANGATVTISNFISGSAATFRLTVVPQSIGYITNSMTVASDNPDFAPGDNQAQIVTLVQSPALLSIQLLATNQVRVSWPSDLTNYVLESKRLLATNFLGTNLYWSNVIVKPLISGSNLSLIETNPGPQKFYRLRR